MSTRAAVLAAATRLLNTEPTASMAQVAAAAGVGRATVHRHFATREELLHEIGVGSLDRWEESLEAVGAAAATDSEDAGQVRAALEAMLARFVVDAQDFAIALTDTNIVAAPALRERCEQIFVREVALYAAGQRTGVLRSDVPARWLGHTVYGLLVAMRDALIEGDIARRDAVDLITTTFFEGSAAR